MRYVPYLAGSSTFCSTSRYPIARIIELMLSRRGFPLAESAFCNP